MVDLETKDQQALRALTAAIKNGLAPFRPGEIAILVRDTGWSKHFSIHIKRWPDHVVEFDMDPKAYLELDRPSDLIEMIARSTLNYFHSLRIEPGPHICLGEE